jgi:hypothetical protein
MPEASAYPNSDISIGAMTAIAVVTIAVLAFWLIMVYVAAREPRPRPTGKPASQSGAPPSGLRSDERSDERRGKTAVTGAAAASGTSRV